MPLGMLACFILNLLVTEAGTGRYYEHKAVYFEIKTGTQCLLLRRDSDSHALNP